jgi:selenocysteine lyase/cysteine desulfurase
MDVEALRAVTPGCRNRTHLNNAGSGLMTTRTLDVMREHLELEAEIGGYEAADRVADKIAATYDALARLVGGTPDQIALFDNSTHAWNAAFYSIPFRPGDRIITAQDEYGSSILAYWQVARRAGADVVVAPNDESGQVDVAALGELIDERTKLIGLTWVPTSGGLVNPAAEVGRVARSADVLYLLDATQVAGQLPVDVAAVGCDMLTGTGRKFLRGPRGTGFLWAGPRAIERLEPHVVEIRSAHWVGGEQFEWADGARRFETWENSYVNILGLGAALEQALELGVEATADRAVALGARLREGLDGVGGVRTHDLCVERCAIVTAAVEGRSAEQVAAVLASRGINVTTTVPEDNQFDTMARGVHPLVRFSPHYYNTEAEVDRAVAAVAEVASDYRA